MHVFLFSCFFVLNERFLFSFTPFLFFFFSVCPCSCWSCPTYRQGLCHCPAADTAPSPPSHVCLHCHSVCRNWATTGFCTYGDRCNFAHHMPNSMGTQHTAGASFTPSSTTAPSGTAAAATSSFHVPSCLQRHFPTPPPPFFHLSHGAHTHSILCAQEPATVPERGQLRLLQVREPRLRVLPRPRAPRAVVVRSPAPAPAPATAAAVPPAPAPRPDPAAPVARPRTPARPAAAPTRPAECRSCCCRGCAQHQERAPDGRAGDGRRVPQRAAAA